MAWAQLVSTTDNVSDPVFIYETTFLIGRGKGCDHCLNENKHISSKHCTIIKDSDGVVWLQDSSTNGTYLNENDKVHKKKSLLTHGDEIHLVKSADLSSNVSYLFQDLSRLAEESDTSDTLEMTQEYDPDFDPQLLEQSSSGKRKSEDETNTSVKDPKRLKINFNLSSESLESQISVKSDTFEMNVSCSSKHQDVKIGSTSDKNEYTGSKVDSNSAGPSKLSSHSNSSSQSSKKCEKRTQLETSLSSSKSFEKTETHSSTFNESIQDLIKTKSTDELVSASVKSNEESSTDIDPYSDTLTCAICQEILYDCVSLQPCLHSFCGGCYSEWETQSGECPSCRISVDGVSKNHLVNNLAEVYLTQHPNMKRTDSDIKDLDQKNKYKHGCKAKRKQNKRNLADDESISDDYSQSEDDYSDEDSDEPVITAHTFPVPSSKCRQCPGSVQNTDANAPSTSHSAGANSMCNSNLVCGPKQVHALCQCCLQLFPHRHDYSCSICHRIYCHAYWGCNKVGCTGCLAKFKDLKYTSNDLVDVILNNHHESNILKDYLQAQQISIADMYSNCMERLDTSEYTCSDRVQFTINSSTLLCRSCGLRNFRDLAFHYRKNIDNSLLPASVVSRTNCYWGKECRTQRCKPHHAVNFNHICERTRTG